MLLIRNIRLPYTAPKEALSERAAAACRADKELFRQFIPVSRSLDARKKRDIVYLWSVAVSLGEARERAILAKGLPDVSAYLPPVPVIPVMGKERPKGRIAVVGLGPGGLFAAELLARFGYRPLVIERGKPVAERTEDVETLWKTGTLDPESNPMFGEGGAGTFSDGKLTSRSKDPRGAEVMRILTENGAPEEIRWLAKPHIGTDGLRRVVTSMRKRIEAGGGEVCFSTKLTGVSAADGRLSAITVQRGGREESIPVSACILATGLGARDTWRMLAANGVALAAKPFAVGARIEHEQRLIDTAQFGPEADTAVLGAAEYRVTAETAGRGVYSFCMCPGGFVVNTASEAGMLSVNGMSYAARSGKNANAALIVQVPAEDFGSDPLGGIAYVEKIERAAYSVGGGYAAPACRLEDFLLCRAGKRFGDVLPTVRPEPVPADLRRVLPDPVSSGIAGGIAAFARQIRGFDCPDAVLTAPETRSSAPLRILRDAQGESVSLKGLFPVGEGAGYAGGIVSAAIDGMKAAEQVIARFAPEEAAQ